ncbi:hypothetical protein G7Y89_g3576 [Cudoniella acicularis]|uniref:Ubiquitin-like domain-containing protein n=1 Tax=Cudoniella acicularis TaxID=354080 RepID=A0A8H4RU22_9HELO|nr:hypothetical protein G7Y89_g3576 [Cudoniella acicularis]
MAAPGFGFSFGDFVQAISLLNDVRKALRDAGGAKDEFKHVSVDLQHLEILLEQLNRGKWDQGGDAGHLNAVKGMALTCRVPLQEFLAKIEKYKVLQNEDLSGFKDVLSRGRRKVQWAVNMRDEVEKFRALIVAKVVAINLLIQLHVVSAISSIDSRTKAIEQSATASQAHQRVYKETVDHAAEEMRNVVTAQASMKQEISRLVQICTGTNVGVVDFRSLIKVQHSDFRRRLHRIEQQQRHGFLVVSSTSRDVISRVSRIESILRQLLRVFGGFSVTALKLLRSILQTDLEIYALLRQIQNNLPPKPIRAINNSFRFTDALGRAQELEYQWFKHWEVFESMLKCEFKQLPGEQRVLLGHYHILNAKRKSLVISPDEWEQSIFPGSEISCGAENPLPSDSSVLVICSTCSLEYHCIGVVLPVGDRRHKKKNASVLELPTRPNISGQPNFESTNKATSTDLPNTLQKDRSDLEAFKSIHIQTPFEQEPKPKRKKQPTELQEATKQQHEIYSDKLLDYFLRGKEFRVKFIAPDPPADFRPDWLVDNDRHTALHWASAVGDIKVIQQLKTFDANLACQNIRGETPLMRAVSFTNCWDDRTMPAVVRELILTVGAVDFLQATALHHAVAAVDKKPFRYREAQWYINTIMKGINDNFGPEYALRVLDAQDVDGNTALHIAAKVGARGCFASLENLGARTDIRNNDGFTPHVLLIRNRKLDTEGYREDEDEYDDKDEDDDEDEYDDEYEEGSGDDDGDDWEEYDEDENEN